MLDYQNHYSENEIRLIRHYGLDDICQRLDPLSVYRMMAEKAFLKNEQNAYANAVRRGLSLLLEGRCFRLTPEFDAEIHTEDNYTTVYEEALIQVNLGMLANDDVLVCKLLDNMEVLWRNLDDQSKDLFDDLSDDLYILLGKRYKDPLLDGETDEIALRKAYSMFADGNYRECLNHLRRLTDLSPAHIHFYGQCWKMLGFHLGASQFFAHASKLDHSAEANYNLGLPGDTKSACMRG